jgi:hypothetical protein
LDEEAPPAFEAPLTGLEAINHSFERRKKKKKIES